MTLPRQSLWASALARHLAAAAMTSLALCAADSAALALLRPGIFSSAATWLQLIFLSLGAILSLLLPAAALLAALGSVLDRPRLRAVSLASSALALATCVFALNLRFAGNKVGFLVALLVAAAALGAFLNLALLKARGRRKLSIGMAAAAGLLAAILFALDVTQLPGLYSTQHVTVGLFTWLLLHSAFLLVLSLRARLLPESRGLRLACLSALIPVPLSVLLFWVTPGDAVGEGLRWAATSGSTVTREVLHLLAAGTDFDRDGHASLLGRGDCEPFDSALHPGAPETAGDGIDGNCMAGDPSVDQVSGLRRHLSARRPPLGRSWRNVLLVSVDALRHDRVFGPRAAPPLAALVSRGLVMERAWCLYPGTVPSLYGMVTSRPPSSFELSPYQSFEFPSDDRSPTLFEVAEQAGVRTGAVVFHGSLSPRFGITRGAGKVWAPGMSGEGIFAPQTTEQALAMLDELKGDRFLLWVHYFDPHAPYDVPSDSPLKASDDLTRYDAEVERVAAELPVLVAALEERGLSNDTAVVFFADHGEEFREHQGVFHGQALYEESVRVPLAFLLPGLPPGSDPTPTSLLDVAPTVLELLGLADSTPATFFGRSLGALLAGAGTGRNDAQVSTPGQAPVPIFPEVFQKGRTRVARSVILWPWKLIRREDDDAFELYDLENDPGELRNLFDPRPAEATALEQLLDRYLAFPESSLR